MSMTLVGQDLITVIENSDFPSTLSSLSLRVEILVVSQTVGCFHLNLTQCFFHNKDRLLSEYERLTV